jgi:hypothetical protein
MIKSNSGSDNEYKIIKAFENKDTIVCRTPDTIPSISGISVFDILPVREIQGKYNKIKIRLTADIVINDFLWKDKQMMLKFVCSGKDHNYVSKEIITNYVLEDDILCNEKYGLSAEKEIEVRDLERFFIHVCITSNEKDKNWERNKKITVSNMKVAIWGK